MKRRFDPFLIGLAAAVALAWLFPEPGASGGWLYPELLNKAGIALIFFLHGAALPLAALKAGTLKWRVHAVIQAATFIVFPLIGVGIWWWADGRIGEDLRIGLFYLCALPSTVSSSVALTAAARGDVAVAVFNATTSSLLGIVLTPLWLGAVIGTSGPGVPVGEVILDLVRWLLLPFAAGQALRPWIGAFVARHKAGVSRVDRGTILVLVYTSFCDSMVMGVWSRETGPTVLGVTVLSFVLYGVVMIVMWGASKGLGLTWNEAIAAMFCGSKKSLATGVPMAQIVFAQGGGALGIILLPIMIYHALQLVLSGALASRWGRIPTAS